MKKIRLMLVTHDLAVGGLQQVVVNLCKFIDKQRFEVSVLCLRDLGEFVQEVEKEGVRVLAISQKKNGTDYLSFLKVAQVFNQEKIEVIHTHNTQPLIDGTIASFLSLNVKTIVHTDHGRSFPDKKRYMLAEWIASHFVYKIVGVSDATSENLINYEKIPKNKILTLHNGIDTSRYDVSVDKNVKLNALGIDRIGPIIGVIARLSKEKGIDYLLEAMPIILKRFNDCMLVVIGDGNLKDFLIQKTNSLGINKHVLFTGTRLDIPEILKCLDLYVLPSVSEGLPMVLLEAMAAHCPIVATAVGGVPTIIHHNVTGSIVKPGDSGKLANEIIRVLSDEDLRHYYVKNSDNVIRNKFNVMSMVKNYEKLYLRQLLD
jgi:glycosyltransferase involved in cell wall biosynthesis